MCDLNMVVVACKGGVVCHDNLQSKDEQTNEAAMICMSHHFFARHRRDFQLSRHCKWDFAVTRGHQLSYPEVPQPTVRAQLIIWNAFRSALN